APPVWCPAAARRCLYHQAAGPPVPNPRTFPIAAPIVPRHGRADEGRQLLGLAEIGVRGIHERLVIERDDALITLLVRAAVDGHGHVTLAEQRALVAAASGLGEPGVGLVGTGLAPQLAGRPGAGPA